MFTFPRPPVKVPHPALLGTDTSELINAVAWLVFAIAFLLFIGYMAYAFGRRLTSMSADVHGMKVSLNTEVKPALGLEASHDEPSAPDAPFRLPPPVPAAPGRTVVGRVGALEDRVTTLTETVERLTETVARRSKQTARMEAALIAQLGVTLPDIPDPDPRGRHE